MNMTEPVVGYSPVAEAEQYLAAAYQSARSETITQLLDRPDWRWLAAKAGAAAARHLEGVARVLADEGWTQGSFRRGGLCLFGALQRAAELGFGDALEAPGKAMEDSSHFLAGAYLNLMVEARTGEYLWFPAWNDEPGRTFDEVLELVQDAAAFARTR